MCHQPQHSCVVCITCWIRAQCKVGATFHASAWCARLACSDTTARDLTAAVKRKHISVNMAGVGLLSPVVLALDTMLRLGIRLMCCGEGKTRPATA